MEDDKIVNKVHQQIGNFDLLYEVNYDFGVILPRVFMKLATFLDWLTMWIKHTICDRQKIYVMLQKPFS